MNGSFDSALEKLSKVLKLNPDYIPALNQLAGIYESRKDFEQAIIYLQRVIQLQPNNMLAHAKLARAMMAQKKTQEAIASYQKAIAFQPEQPAWVYHGLGDALKQNGQIDEAIATYQKAIELKSDHPYFYIKLAELDYMQGQIDRAIKGYQKAIKLKPDLSFQIYKCLEELLRLQGRIKEAGKWIKSAPLPQDGESYLSIWNALNQTTLNNWQQESSSYPTAINQQAAKQYFTQTSQQKIINLKNIRDKDRQLIESLGWSLTYLKLNRSGLINHEIVSQEEYASHFKELQCKERREHLRIAAATKFQLSTVEDGYMYAICPSTGIRLHSNRSIYYSGHLCFCWYRFVGQEVFYLITGDHWREKLALYFPSSELIVSLTPSQVIKAEDISLFKAYVVTDWKRIAPYILSSDKTEKVAIIWFRHFAHHLWNELSAIYQLYESNSLDKIDRFLVVNEPLGCIDEIFPEIPSEKIKLVKPQELSREILENNYFLLSLGHAFIKEELAKRVYQVSLHKCSPAFLTGVESAKKKHFPLLWISIRLGSRTWISQVEGLANVIKSLAENFPNLGVVIDGFSLPENREGFVNPQHETTIKKEKETVQKILSLLPPGIKIYDAVGCWLHQSIVLAYAIDLYLTHHGTIQHKVGWTSNKPGVVHTNKEILKLSPSVRPGSWEREKGIVPVYVPKQHIVGVDEKVYTHHGKWEKKTGFYNYECDWRGVYQEVFKLALSIKDKRVKADLNFGNQLKKKVRVSQALDETKSNSMSNNLVIVIGRGNSGTRLISYTLYASGIYMGERLNSAGDKIPPSPIYQACRIMAKYVKWNGNLSWDFSGLFTAEIPDDFKQLVNEYLADILKFPKTRIKGWKLPETTLIYPWIVRMFPDAKYIHWLRDPRDSVATEHLTDDLNKFEIKYPTTDNIREQRAISWYYQYQLMKETPKPKNLILVRYEDFVLKQEETLARLEEFLEVPLARVVVRKDAIGRWKTDKDKHFFPFFKPDLYFERS